MRSTQSLAQDAPNALIAGSWEGSQGKAHCTFVLVPFTLSLSICGWLLSETGYWAKKTFTCKTITLH